MPKILEPIKVGKHELKNRLMYLAMAKYLSDAEGFITDRQVAYYENYAKNDVALIAPGVFVIDETYPSRLPNQPGLYDEKFIPGLKKLTDAVHAAGGKILFQPWHPGAAAYGCGPDKVKHCVDWTVDEIHEIQRKYLRAAIISQKSGADGIEFHIAHNYLPEQFSVPLFNKRTDEYGADTIENGLRFSLECIEMIRKECGEDFLITAKINGNDFADGGATVDTAVEIAILLEKAGVSLVSVSAGGALSEVTGMSGDGFREEGWKVPLAEAVKKKVDIPVMATGSIRHPEYVEKILAEGRCDMVGMGRGLLADPEWIKKLAEGKEDDIKFCISCMSCFDYSPPGESNCSVNPLSLREYQNITLINDGDDREVAIVGAGPAGLEAAVNLAKRGFKPIVFEKESEIGGMELQASVPDGKQKILWHIEYYKNQLDKLGVELRLGKAADYSTLSDVKPYAIIFASGSKPIWPSSIPGIDKPHVLKNREVLKNLPKFKDENIVVVGSGQVGLELATTFAHQGNKVTIVDMIEKQPEILPMDNRLSIGYAIHAGVDIKLGQKLIEITDIAVKTEDIKTGEKLEISASKVIICMGVNPENTLYEECKDKFERVVNIGDSLKPAKIRDAVQAGFNAAIDLK